MKYNGNKILWRFAALVAVVLTVSACGETNEPTGNGLHGSSIEFNIDIQSSRANPITNSSLDRIGVFGYSTSLTDWDDTQKENLTADYFLNKMVVKTENGRWWYDGPAKYWPGEGLGKLTFFAYAPFIDVQDIYTLHPADESATGAPTITYTPPADARRQVDLLWDKKENMESGIVRFEMNHALTAIGFEARMPNDIHHRDAPYTIEILSVDIRNVIASGVFHLDEGQWQFDSVTDASQLTGYRLTPEENKGLNDVTFHCQYDPVETPGYTDPFAGYVSLNKPYATIMLLPQEFRDGTGGLSGYPTIISITYRKTNLLTGEQNDITENIELASHPTASGNLWTSGKSITYQFTISLFDGVAVRVRVALLDPWVKDGEATVDIS